ncbi:MAG: M14 family metallopeptidase [Desulfobacterales bacterium]|jgi:hypothetical protein
MPSPTIEDISLPAASMANRRTLKVFRYGEPGRRPKAYLQAGLHSDEAPGFLVMHHLMARLDSAQRRGEISGEIVLVPVANPIGVAQWRNDGLQGRFDYFDGVNFNRDHLDLKEKIAEQVADRLTDSAEVNVVMIRKAAGEALASMTPTGEAGALKHRLLTLAHDADIVLDLHCDHQAVMHVYMGASLWPEGEDLPGRIGAEVVLLADDSGVTPFDEACSRIWWQLAHRFPDHPVPSACLAATIELRGIADLDHGMAAADAENLYRFLQGRAVIRGTAPPIPMAVDNAMPLAGVEQLNSPVPGVVVFMKSPGDWVKSGDVVAEVVNPLAGTEMDRVFPLQAAVDGILFARSADRFARPGRILAKIAGRKSIRSAGDNLLTL